MKSHKEAKAALSEKAALLVTRLIETSSKRAENAARRWAKQSPTHMLEILKTLCSVKNLHAISVLAEELPDTPPPRGNPCRDREVGFVRHMAMKSSVAREEEFSAPGKVLRPTLSEP
jgi:ferric-dicitrate binding protein FerR (iron transport regulator)